MDLGTFSATNIRDGDKGRFVQEFNDPRINKRMAYFEDNGTCYTATATANSAFGPLFSLCGAGIKGFNAITNYDNPSPGELGALKLHSAGYTYNQASFGKTHSIKAKLFKSVGMRVTDALRAEYPIPSNVSPILADIQSESASVKRDNGSYQSCGTRTVHRLYMATAFTILRKMHQRDARDGVVALVVERNGRIISWGRKNPAIPCWHGETSAIMGLKGRIPPGSTVYSTLKPCNMCAGIIHDASGGDAKVFWGQDDPGSMAKDTILERDRRGTLLDGNKRHDGARAILLQDRRNATAPMPGQLGSAFQDQRQRGHKSTIDYIVTEEAATIVRQAEAFLKTRYTKYEVNAPEHFNENAAFVVRYLTGFLRQLGLQPENLGG